MILKNLSKMVVSLKYKGDSVSAEKIHDRIGLLNRHVTWRNLRIVGIKQIGMCEYDAVTIFVAIIFEKGPEPISLLPAKSAVCCVKAYIEVLSLRKNDFKPIYGRSDQLSEFLPSVIEDVVVA